MDRFIEFNFKGTKCYRIRKDSVNDFEIKVKNSRGGISIFDNKNTSRFLGDNDDFLYTVSDSQYDLFKILKFHGVYPPDEYHFKNYDFMPKLGIAGFSEDGIFVNASYEREFNNDVFNIMSIVLTHYKKYSQCILPNQNFIGCSLYVKNNHIFFKTYSGNYMYAYEILDEKKFRSIIVKELMLSSV